MSGACITISDDLASCLAIRRSVFIDEQGVPETLEIDGLDGDAIHLIAWQNGRAVGTARLLIDGAVGKIGRVAVLAQARGTGLGAALIRASLAEFRRRPGVTTARLGAQTHALIFYEKLGFQAFGPIYDDAGIPHQDMSCPIDGK